jgi:hypothetical protein
MYLTKFEHCGNYICVTFGGRALIRCASRDTDLRDDEPLDSFVARHGGNAGVASYLSECLRK